MTSPAVPLIPPPTDVRAVASPRHSAILIAILLAVAFQGARFQAAPADPAVQGASHAPLYLTLIASEWLLVYAVARGIRRSGTTVLGLVGGRWRTTREVITDLVWASAFWATLLLVAAGWERWLPSFAAAKSVNALLPRTPTEIVLWIALSVSAGFAEEVVFRGYFQRQFAAWTRSAVLGVAIQAVLFGVTHGYQGLDACLRITVLGALFGALALLRRSLRPGIIAHAWTDIASGVFRI